MRDYLLLGCSLCLTIASLGACGGKEEVRREGVAGAAQGGEGGNGQPEGGGTSHAGSGAGGNGTGGLSAVISTEPADKLDLLFVIDNSLTMGDKQTVLASAVPQLLRRLTNPDCVSTDGALTTVMDTPTSPCPSGQARAFTPVDDIHIGAVTSSLGDFGGTICPETVGEQEPRGFPDQNDHGWLLGALPRVKATGLVADPFLAWSATDASSYTSVIDARAKEFQDYVTVAGELGCGFEMTLESWYRFLIDPRPPVDVGREGSLPSKRSGTDPDILAQRAAFLRSDSLVAVVMLSDENDCSFKDSNAYSWWPTSVTKSPDAFGNPVSNYMFRPSKACASAGPNDRCCYSCMLGGVDNSIPQDCLDADPTCRYANSEYLPDLDDAVNLRCLHQKQRFGYDFLFPVTRYSNALSLKTLCPDQTYGDLDCDCTAAKAKGVACDPGEPVGNPLYANLSGTLPSGPDRDDPSRVFFAGILGVPWQDLATDAVTAQDPKGKDGSVALQYKRASELDWDLFAPVNEYATPPGDPMMIEQVAPRAGTQPITGEALVAPTGAKFMANSINGHEWAPMNNGDIQFACIFSLAPQMSEGSTSAIRDCALAVGGISPQKCSGLTDEALRECMRRSVGCACSGSGSSGDLLANMSPLCQQTDGSYTTTQVAARAHPGVRELQALRAFHSQNNDTDNAIVASICPKDLTYANRASSGYGYNPAVMALANQMATKLAK